MTSAAAITRIHEQLDRMRAICGDERLFTTNERVSAWSPAEHVDHALRVAAAMLERIPSTDVLPKGINLLGRTILTLGWIPRGVSRAPRSVLGQRATLEELHSSFSAVTAALGTLDPAAVDGARTRNVPHPRFGGLTPAQALRFLVIHNDHHLKIVRDVLRNA